MKLMEAALDGMLPLALESSSDEVVNALLNLARRSVLLALMSGCDMTQFRAFFSDLMLLCTNDGRVQ